MRCEVTVPCLTRCEDGKPCGWRFEVKKLIEDKKNNRPKRPCPICNEWQGIEQLLHNAPAARPNPLEELLFNSGETIRILRAIYQRQETQQDQIIGRSDQSDAANRELLSNDGLMQALVDEAKGGPRLFSFELVEPGFWDRPK